METAADTITQLFEAVSERKYCFLAEPDWMELSESMGDITTGDEAIDAPDFERPGVVECTADIPGLMQDIVLAEELISPSSGGDSIDEVENVAQIATRMRDCRVRCTDFLLKASLRQSSPQRTVFTAAKECVVLRSLIVVNHLIVWLRTHRDGNALRRGSCKARFPPTTDLVTQNEYCKTWILRLWPEVVTCSMIITYDSTMLFVAGFCGACQKLPKAVARPLAALASELDERRMQIMFGPESLLSSPSEDFSMSQYTPSGPPDTQELAALDSAISTCNARYE